MPRLNGRAGAGHVDFYYKFICFIQYSVYMPAFPFKYDTWFVTKFAHFLFRDEWEPKSNSLPIMAQYGKATYWDERYTKDAEQFDWYQRYGGLKDLLNQYVKKTDDILMAGAGNSRLSEEMVNDGYQKLMNVDVSEVVVKQMATKYEDRAEQLQWQTMNMCSLEFADETYDAVVDKGTMDSILCGEGSTANVAKMCQEIHRVLKPNGVYFIVSYGVPDNRLSYLENKELQWKVVVHTVPKPTVSAVQVSEADANAVHYIYVCQKGVKAD